MELRKTMAENLASQEDESNETIIKHRPDLS